jgi:hypothetical protein
MKRIALIALCLLSLVYFFSKEGFAVDKKNLVIESIVYVEGEEEGGGFERAFLSNGEIKVSSELGYEYRGGPKVKTGIKKADPQKIKEVFEKAQRALSEMGSLQFKKSATPSGLFMSWKYFKLITNQGELVFGNGSTMLGENIEALPSSLSFLDSLGNSKLEAVFSEAAWLEK